LHQIVLLEEDPPINYRCAPLLFPLMSSSPASHPSAVEPSMGLFARLCPWDTCRGRDGRLCWKTARHPRHLYKCMAVRCLQKPPWMPAPHGNGKVPFLTPNGTATFRDGRRHSRGGQRSEAMDFPPFLSHRFNEKKFIFYPVRQHFTLHNIQGWIFCTPSREGAMGQAGRGFPGQTWSGDMHTGFCRRPRLGDRACSHIQGIIRCPCFAKDPRLVSCTPCHKFDENLENTLRTQEHEPCTKAGLLKGQCRL